MSEKWTISQFKEHIKKSKEIIYIENSIKLLNLEVKNEHIFHPKRKWRFDFAVIDLKIGIEYEGIISAKSRHTTIKGYSEDCNKYNEAQKLGWCILRYTAMNYKNIVEDLNQLVLAKRFQKYLH